MARRAEKLIPAFAVERLRRGKPALVILCVAMTARVLALGSATPPQQPASQTVSPSASIDVVVLGRDARGADVLGTDDFRVTVDGQLRRVIGVRHVSRGPGAVAAATARQQTTSAIRFGAETSRTILVVLDQAMLQRGDEKTVIQAARVFLDRLGLEDRVAVVRLPVSSTIPITLTTDRPATRDALNAVAGQSVEAPPAADANAATAKSADAAAAAVNPDRANAADAGKAARAAEASAEAAAPLPTEDLERARMSMASLLNVLKGLQRLPGRKIIVLFSAGFPMTAQAAAAPLESVASAAAAARAVVYAFGVRATRTMQDRLPPDFSGIDTLARNTGGLMAMLERDPARTIDKVTPELASCYVLSIETSPRDGASPRPLRVETTRRGFSVRAPAFLALRDDPDDPAPSAPAPAAAHGLPVGNRARLDTRAATQDANLELALSRLIEYVAAYQRGFSAVVAEEKYVQSVPGRPDRTLRSDFLLVRPADSEDWVSFRDVFEVDGKPVRDREQRLQQLFLDNPTQEALVLVQKVQDESARYNIGSVLRNINVPLFPLRVVLLGNRPRFHFTLGSKGETQGVATWRIEYEERVRPTLVQDSQRGADVPIKGWFVVDQVTGAIIETRMEAINAPGNGQGQFDVRYRQDPRLGLWVPDDMRESYHTISGSSLLAVGRARYSNFRRFQVKVEEKLKVPK